MRKKHGKTKWILFGSAVVAFSLASCSSKNDSILKGENTQTAASTDEDDGGTKLVVGKDGKVYIEYKDENGNGIPDEFENLYANKSTGELFSVTLGSAVALVVNIIYLIYNMTKTKKTNQSIKDMCADSVKFVSDFKNSANQNSESTKAVLEQNRELLARIGESEKTNAEQTEQIKALKESNEALSKSYADINNQMNAILANQAAMANTPENTKAGINRIVQKNTKEALINGKKQGK